MSSRPSPGSPTTVVTRRLRCAFPYDAATTVRFHGLHAVPGVESFDGTTFTRTLVLPGGPGRIAVAAANGGVDLRLELTDRADLDTAVARVRHLLDLDVDRRGAERALGRDPQLAPLVLARPGLRSPGTVDGVELGVRTVVGQQVSLAGARTVLGRIAAAHGHAAFDDAPGLLFPSAATLAALDPTVLPLPRARGRAVVALAAAARDGAVTLVPEVDADAATAALLALPGIGPWTARYLRMRVFGDPDVLLDTDLAVRRVAAGLGIDLTGHERWAPHRTLVTHHLWAQVLAALG